MIRLYLLLALGCLLGWSALSSPVQAQTSLSSSLARQYGLTKVWQTQIDMDRGRGRMAGLNLHISPTRVYQVFELTYKGRVYRHSELDLDAYGVKIGAAEAKKKALDRLAIIKTEMAEAKDNSPPPKLITHVVPETTIYATSERGTVHAIDGETGLTRWSISVGNPDYPTTAAGANNEFAAVINGSRLYVIKASDGTIAFERRIAGAPAAGPGVTAAYVFVPGVTGAVEVFELDKPTYPTKTFYSTGRTLLQPTATERTVCWTTDLGALYSANGRIPGMRFRLTMPGGCTTPPAILYPDRIIVASDNGHMYCVHEAKGNVIWRVSTGESVTRPPFAVNNTAYLLTDNNGLFAVQGDTGKEKWFASGINGFLAGSDKRLYMSDLTGNVAILDAETGGRLGTIPASGLDFRYQNMLTDRIILGTTTGQLQMYREVAHTWPMVHRGDDVPSVPSPEAKPVPGGDAGQPAPLEPGAPGVDPFGGPVMPMPLAPMPKPMENKPPEDPFDPFK